MSAALIKTKKTNLRYGRQWPFACHQQHEAQSAFSFAVILRFNNHSGTITMGIKLGGVHTLYCCYTARKIARLRNT